MSYDEKHNQRVEWFWSFGGFILGVAVLFGVRSCYVDERHDGDVKEQLTIACTQAGGSWTTHAGQEACWKITHAEDGRASYETITINKP